MNETRSTVGQRPETGFKLAAPLTLGQRKLLYIHLRSIYTSGSPLVQGLGFLAQGAPARGLARLGAELQEGLTAGREFKDMTPALNRALPPAEAALLVAGDRSGSMPEILRSLEERTDDRIRARNDLLKRAAYPALVAFVGCFLLPIPLAVSSGVGAWLTEALGNLAWLVSLLILILALARYGRPLIGPLLRLLPGVFEHALLPGNRIDFLRILRTGLVAGLPLGMTLEIASEAWASQSNRRQCTEALRRLNQGSDLTDSLGGLLRPVERFTLAAGERSGTLDEALAGLLEAADGRASVRRRLIAVVLAMLLTLGILGLTATKVMQGLSEAVMPDSGAMKQLQRELKGTGLHLFD